jgi:hypothetical protein
MASAYPGGLDSFTNPTSTDGLDLPPHADQHADANDAIEAIQATLGVDPQGAYDTVAERLDAGGGGGGGGPIASGSVSAAGSLTITGFDSGKRLNRLSLYVVGSTDVILKAQLKVSGTPSTSGYSCTRAYWGTGSGTDNDQQGSDEWMWSVAGAGGPSVFGIDLTNVALAEKTAFAGVANVNYAGRYTTIISGDHSAATAYDSIVVTPDTGTITAEWELW